MTTSGRYAVSDARVLQPLLRHPLGALLVHWVVQGMLQMDRTERTFKLGLDVCGGLLGALLLQRWFGWPLAGLTGWLVAHTLNMVCNGHVFVVLKHFGSMQHDRERIRRYLAGVEARVRREPSVRYAALFGSIARGEWQPTSDIDVRLVRRSGMWAGLRACGFALAERTRATWGRIAVDVYVLDGPAALATLRRDEPAVVLHDPEGLSRDLDRPWTTLAAVL